MEITEVRVKLMNDKDEKLQAFCSVTFNDDFVIRDLKIIGGTKGAFVAMPSRKLMDRCPKCYGKNHLRARYCNDCGTKLNPNRADQDRRGRARLHTDIAHPINSRCREEMQQRIIEAFEEEMRRSKEPGYVAPSLDDDDLLEGYQAPPLHDRKTRNFTRQEVEQEHQPKRRGEDSFDAGIFS
ncbi:MAG: SpoVG family protein [Planctomycetes bacterium]|nr:SpoVG family protein [Planctomycetota bacterium]